MLANGRGTGARRDTLIDKPRATVAVVCITARHTYSYPRKYSTMTTRHTLLISAFGIGLALTAGVASATPIAFGDIQTFEMATVGTQPRAWTDATNGYVGQITVVSNATSSVSAGPNGGSQFAKVTPGPDNSYSGGYRNGPYGAIGTQTAFPGSGNRYTTFIDVYAQSTTSSTGHLYWDSIVSDTEPGFGADTGWYMTPGDTTWTFSTPGEEITLPSSQWYTLEVVWDRSETIVTTFYNIYHQGQRTTGAALASFGGGPVDEGLLSAALGGPNLQWFTVWDNDAVGRIFVDNAGTAIVEPVSVPEPAPLPLTLLGIGGVLLIFIIRRPAAR